MFHSDWFLMDKRIKKPMWKPLWICVLYGSEQGPSWSLLLWNFTIHHHRLQSLLTMNRNLFVTWVHTSFCVNPAGIRFNVTRDRNGINECKSPHFITAGPTFPWLPAMELMIEGWNGGRRLGNLIINFLPGLLKPLMPFHSHFTSLPFSL